MRKLSRPQSVGRLTLALWVAALLTALAGCSGGGPSALPATGFPVQAEETAPVAGLQAVSPTLPAPASNPIAKTQTPAPTLTAEMAAQEALADFQLPPEERTHYKLDATLDYYAHSLTVQEQVAFANRTTARLNWIPLMVEALRYPGTFQLGKIYGEQGERMLQHRLEGTTLKLTLPDGLEPGETLIFSLTYSLQLLDINKLPQLRPYPLGYNDQQANFGDWYPFVPPYVEGKGWLAYDPAFYGEHLVYDVSDYDVAIRFSEGPENLTVAASSPAVWEDGVVHFRVSGRRNFAWSVSPYYEVATQTVPLDEGRSVEASSYYFPYHAEAGQSLLEAMEQALTLYSRLFGAYPHASIAAVQVDMIDGMEYDGLFFLSTDYYNWHRDEAADFLKSLAAHETAHQWWMGLVGSDQALEPWLDEALCTYSEALFYETYYPEALDWWWAYRVNYYEPQGWVDMSIYDAPQAVNQYRKYRDPVYLRGALFLAELRNAMGAEAFFDALREYARRYAYRQADEAGFIQIMNEHSTQDLKPIIGKFLSKLEG